MWNKCNNSFPVLCLLVPRQVRQLEDDDNEPANCGGEDGVPLITPCKNSLKLQVHEPYTLQCEADEPIQWWHGHEGSKISEEFDNVIDNSRPFGIKLHLENVSVENVGAYYCIKTSQAPKSTTDWSEEQLVELVNDDKASTIYVYVNDPNNLLAPVEPILNAVQYSEIVVPCKPAMPETEVLLTFNGEVSLSMVPTAQLITNIISLSTYPP